MIFTKKKKIKKLINEIEDYIIKSEYLIDEGLRDLYHNNNQSKEESFETKNKFENAYGTLVLIKNDILCELRELVN